MSSNIRDSKTTDELVVDLPHIFGVLFKRLWIIGIIALICASVGFAYSSFALEPKYSSSTKMYVNNKGVDIGNFSFTISNNDLLTSQGFVPVIAEILLAEDTLTDIISNANLEMSPAQLAGMIVTKQSNNTQIFIVTVTTDNPYLSARIASEVTRVLPEQIKEITKNSVSATIVDSPRANLTKVSPSITRYTAIGFLAGFVVSALIIAIIAMMDDAIHDENYILEHYNFPMLAKIPDLYDNSESKYSYYSKDKSGTEEAVEK